MLSVLITAFREAETVGRAIAAFLVELPPDAELLVVCPDPQTTAVVEHYQEQYPAVRHVRDSQQGKPTALNVGLRAASGEIVVLSDGDVFVDEGALPWLLAPFADARVGAVSGRPVSTSPRNTVLGYWSHLLTDAGAHRTRLARNKDNEFLVCSGYLFAVRRHLVEELPKDALAEDAVISHRVAQQGFQIRYAPEARVFVKYPSTYRDWLLQRTRSAGGYAQEYVRRSPYRMRSPWLEILRGTPLALRYPGTARECWWTLLLFAARLHLWLLVLVNVRVLRRSHRALWKRVESTK